MQAVRGVEFAVEKGEIMGIVGESGSGKSVTMKAVMGILPENAKVEYDSLKLNGKELAGLSAEEYRKLRGKEMTMIFQDPMTALNPLKKIGSQLEEVILRHSKLSRQGAKEKAIEMLRRVLDSELRETQTTNYFSVFQRIDRAVWELMAD